MKSEKILIFEEDQNLLLFSGICISWRKIGNFHFGFVWFFVVNEKGPASNDNRTLSRVYQAYFQTDDYFLRLIKPFLHQIVIKKRVAVLELLKFTQFKPLVLSRLNLYLRWESGEKHARLLSKLISRIERIEAVQKTMSSEFQTRQSSTGTSSSHARHSPKVRAITEESLFTRLSLRIIKEV